MESWSSPMIYINCYRFPCCPMTLRAHSNCSPSMCGNEMLELYKICCLNFVVFLIVKLFEKQTEVYYLCYCEVA